MYSNTNSITLNMSIEKIKSAFSNMDIYYDTEEEYLEAMDNLVAYFDLLIQIDQEQKTNSKNT